MPVTVPPFEANPGLVELSLRIGDHVRTRRQARGMSRRMLSKNSGVSERYLAQLETGNGNVTVGILHRLSLVFGCSVEDLIGGGTKPKAPPESDGPKGATARSALSLLSHVGTAPEPRG